MTSGHLMVLKEGGTQPPPVESGTGWPPSLEATLPDCSFEIDHCTAEAM